MTIVAHNQNASESKNRLSLVIRGMLQGVGFRPFVYRLATELNLRGWVNNSAQGVVIEVEGHQPQLETFLTRIECEHPPHASIQNLESQFFQPIGYKTFEIRPSVDGDKTVSVLPDLATCPACTQEIFDPSNRYYHYPFTTCTNCGPRFSILKAIPYDRTNTTMAQFEMCDQCCSEYTNPRNRRFHAQSNACPHCGPQLELWTPKGKALASNHEALLMAAAEINQGKILAIKGLGGFHLIADARNDVAINRLRQAKQRPDKPFALMYPSLDLIQSHCEVSALEEQLLTSPEAPIVLLKRRSIFDQAQQLLPATPVAPGNPFLGIMLPYTPLHHLLMTELGFPVIATSGNLSDEPICIDEQEALQRLSPIADLFLVHNRPIVNPVDDSVVRVIMGRAVLLRRARGYAPLTLANAVCDQPLATSESVKSLTPSEPNSQNRPPLLAVGGHLKNTIALSINRQILVSQHIGNLETAQTFKQFQQTITNFKQLYELEPAAVACDIHPGYRSSTFAQQLGLPVIPVQHHYAHALACMADNGLTPPVLGIVWDGTGYGLDSTIWGGEFLLVSETSFTRAAHLRTFCLPGGEQAVKEPRRSALGLLYECFGDNLFGMTELESLQAFCPQELEILRTMLVKQINCPMTSSAGRLFDAVASILGIRHRTTFEGQAAMELEFALEGTETEDQYTFQIIKDAVMKSSTIGENTTDIVENAQFPIQIDWKPMILEILEDWQAQRPIGLISAKFHNTLAATITAVAKILKHEQVLLTGGCFQNQYLTEQAIKYLQQANFRPYWHRLIPPNDGGIALGQMIAAMRTF